MDSNQQVPKKTDLQSAAVHRLCSSPKISEGSYTYGVYLQLSARLECNVFLRALLLGVSLLQLALPPTLHSNFGLGGGIRTPVVLAPKASAIPG